MATIVKTEAELNSVLAANSDDIIFGNDITVTTYNDYQFNHNIDGAGHTLNLLIPSSSQGSHWAFLNSFSGEMHHLNVTGVINATNVSYANNGAPIFVHMGTNGHIHDIVIDDLTISGNFTYSASWALFGNPDNNPNAVVENIWINNFSVEAQSSSNARFHIVGANVTVDRISISNSSQIFPVSIQTAIITNGYIYNSDLSHAPTINGAAFNAKSGSNNLYVHSNVTWSGGTRSESDTNGRVRDNPDFEALRFTPANHWNVSSGYPRLTSDPIPIIISGDEYVEVADRALFRAVNYTHDMILWDFGDGTEPVMRKGGSVPHTYQSSGIYTVTASLVVDPSITGSFEVCVYGISIEGDPHFANNREHTLTAVGILPDEGSYTWSDGQTGPTHVATYTGYEDGDTIPLEVIYELDDVELSASITLVCVKGSLTLASDILTPTVTQTVNLTTTYQGYEVPTSRALKHSLDRSTWTSLPYASPYAYTFSDSHPTKHYFRVEYTLPIEGVISHTIALTTIPDGVKIVSPTEGFEAFRDDEIQFSAVTSGLRDPTYLWSDGHTEASFVKSYSDIGTKTMSVTATSIDGTYTASVDIYVLGDFVIHAPETFANGTRVTFSIEGDTPDNFTWRFPDGDYEGTTVARTLTGYTKGAQVEVVGIAEYIDDFGHSHLVTHSVTLRCVYPYSYYQNPRGERFYFDENCVILREGKSGFSEIQVSTDIFKGHDYNAVSGLSTGNRVITFNIFVKGNYSVMHAKRREMVHIMAPQKELGTFSYTRDDGQIFSMRCNIALGSPIFSDEAVSNGWVGTISFIAPNGVWEGVEVTASTDDFVENVGDIPCGFVATLTDNLVNTTNSQQMLAVDGTLAGYKVDTAEGTITKEVGGEWVDAWNDISLSSTLVRLDVGNNTITGCASITFRPLYLGV